jgi:PAS domain S-box-containing protein
MLDARDDGIVAFNSRGKPLYVNAAAKDIFSLFISGSLLDSLRAEILSWQDEVLSGAARQNIHDGSMILRREDEEMILEGIDGRRKTIYRSFLLRLEGRRSVMIAILRKHRAASVLLAERDAIVEDLEESRRAALNIMEDLVRQKDELESTNRMLEEEIAIRRRTEEARDGLVAIVESSEDAIFSCNLQGQVTSWNKSAERLFDYTPREILGRDSGCLVPEEEMDTLRNLQERLSRGEKIASFECVRRTRTARRLHVSTTWSPLLDLRGRMMGYSVIARDISKRIETERELAQYRTHLESVVEQRTKELVASREKASQAERLASIGALAAGIAHEINNPIGAMLLAAQNSLEVLPELNTVPELASTLQRLGQKILLNAKRCGLIVRGVLQFARKQKTEKWPSDINAIIKTSVEIIHEWKNVSHATLVADLAPHLPLVMVNPVEIEQIVMNLIKNACEAGDSGVIVKVMTRIDAAGISIIVEDNGHGIPKEQQAHIFDPFFTTRLERGGTGLGLSIVHGLVAGYGGSIDLQSEVGKGTTITVQLPLKPVQDSDLVHLEM